VTACLLVSAVFFHGWSFSTALGNADRDIEQLERQIFEKVNQERRALGLEALQLNDRLNHAAQLHSRDMAERQYVGHTNPDGYSFVDRVRLAGVRNAHEMAENVGRHRTKSDPAARMVRMWMDSPGHRSNIVNPRFRYTGLGVARTADGTLYFTQLFADRL
jgi:uncharacterized protein YkwD